MRSRPPPRHAALLCGLAVGSLSAARADAADFGAPGPATVVVTQIEDQGDLQGAVAHPAAPTPDTPVIVLAHGFASSPQRMIGWGEHFASHGFIAIAIRNCVGELLCGPDPAAQAALVSKGLAYLQSEAAPATVRVNVAPGRAMFLGHSAGGQAMVLAARDLRPQALVLFDPVGGDQDPASVEPAKGALASVCTSTLTLFAEPHAGDSATGAPSCNKERSWSGFALGSAGPRGTAVVAGSTHCDGELPARAACGFSCGGRADDVRQTTYKRYATAFALAALRGDAAAAEIVGTKMREDAALTTVTIEEGADCSGVGWPGRPVSGGGGGGGSTGAGGAGSAGGATTVPATPAAESGCALRRSTGEGDAVLLLASGVTFALRRRRARRSAR